MANAFYSLYSHVSRTPLQKLATPEFSFSSPVERIERFRTSIRSEPRSPVERLKDTVNKMCLYTGSPRGSDSTSPQPSPRKRSSLPEVVDIMLKSKTGSVKKLELGEHDRCGSCGDFTLLTDGGDMEQTQQAAENTDIYQEGNEICHEVDGSGSPPVLKPSGSYGHCCITVTGWEEEDVSLSSMNSADSCHAPPASSTLTSAELLIIILGWAPMFPSNVNTLQKMFCHLISAKCHHQRKGFNNSRTYFVFLKRVTSVSNGHTSRGQRLIILGYLTCLTLY
ncbi:hypothetical protein GOODEAATRI_006191 [Goodea atripinnis]|uniref:Uncharacterized protein n=1 Tax=Goodea atripinnis TaxID=208336 RepID=A0ABV0PLC1_9TELE